MVARWAWRIASRGSLAVGALVVATGVLLESILLHKMGRGAERLDEAEGRGASGRPTPPPH